VPVRLIPRDPGLRRDRAARTLQATRVRRFGTGERSVSPFMHVQADSLALAVALSGVAHACRDGAAAAVYGVPLYMKRGENCGRGVTAADRLRSCFVRRKSFSSCATSTANSLKSSLPSSPAASITREMMLLSDGSIP